MSSRPPPPAPARPHHPPASQQHLRAHRRRHPHRRLLRQAPKPAPATPPRRQQTPREKSRPAAPSTASNPPSTRTSTTLVSLPQPKSPHRYKFQPLSRTDSQRALWMRAYRPRPSCGEPVGRDAGRRGPLRRGADRRLRLRWAVDVGQCGPDGLVERRRGGTVLGRAAGPCRDA
jgi:hypothetical protein